MTTVRILDAAEFIIKLTQQRVNEAKALNKMDGTMPDVLNLIKEADLLTDAYNLILENLKTK
jgi:hypothetical protein